MPNPFWNASEARLRALWRLLAQVILMFVLLFLGTALIGDVQTDRARAGIVQLIGLGGSVVLAARWFDHRPLHELGVWFNPRWWMHFGFGSLLGVLLISGIFLVEHALGWVQVAESLPSADPISTASFLAILFFFLGVGITEELWMRGYLIPNLAEGMQSNRIAPKKAVFAALVISSVTFALLHTANPNASLVSTLNIILAGVVLGLPFVWTGSLAIPIGLHFTWNATQGAGFGFPVSGLTQFPSLIQTHETGPDHWTGGAFGPEAGLLGVLALLLGAAIIYVWLRLTHRKPTLVASLASPPGAD